MIPYFVSLHHILIGYTSTSFYECLNNNHFSCTFMHFTILLLDWDYFTSYSIALPMSIFVLVFHTLIFVLGVLFTSLLKFHIEVFALLNYGLILLMSCSFNNGSLFLLLMNIVCSGPCTCVNCNNIRTRWLHMV